MSYWLGPRSITGEKSDKCKSYWTDGKCFEQNVYSQCSFTFCNSRFYSMRSKSVWASSAGIQYARDIPLVSGRGPKQAYSVTSPLHLSPARLMFSDLCRPQQIIDYCYWVLTEIIIINTFDIKTFKYCGGTTAQWPDGNTMVPWPIYLWQTINQACRDHMIAV